MRFLNKKLKNEKNDFKIPKSVQDVIPIKTIYGDGIFYLDKNKFLKCYRFSDTNYTVANKEDKEEMFFKYSGLVNSFESGSENKITIINRRFAITIRYTKEVEEYKYELITADDSFQTEGYIRGNIWHISGQIGTEEVYRLYYWIDKTTKEADYQTIYEDQTRVFYDIAEDETPYFVVIQTVEYEIHKIKGTKKQIKVIDEVYELHLPQNAIIQDFNIDLE